MTNKAGLCTVWVTVTRCSTVSWSGVVAQTCAIPFPMSTRFTTGRPSTPVRPISCN